MRKALLCMLAALVAGCATPSLTPEEMQADVAGFRLPQQLPAPVLAVAQALPLYHGVQLVRPLVAGHWPEHSLLHIGVLVAYAGAGYIIALHFARKRFSA